MELPRSFCLGLLEENDVRDFHKRTTLYQEGFVAHIVDREGRCGYVATRKLPRFHHPRLGGRWSLLDGTGIHAILSSAAGHIMCVNDRGKDKDVSTSVRYYFVPRLVLPAIRALTSVIPWFWAAARTGACTGQSSANHLYSATSRAPFVLSTPLSHETTSHPRLNRLVSP